jgi:sodium/hydrogen antiporter
MNSAVLAVISACVLIWGLVSARLERWDVSAPIVFVAFGVITSRGPTAVIHLNLQSSTVRSLAEVTLALVLFADASRVSVRALLADAGLPFRLLAIGLPLTIGAGTALAFGFFGASGIWVAALIGSIVAPTDAALGASIMSDEHVPFRVRRTLNVESGLNDGIVTPFVNIFLAGAVASEALHGNGVGTAAIDLLGGAGIGIGVGLTGGLLVGLARRHRWSSPGFRRLSVLALSLFAYSVALVVGTNGFVAAFVSGMAFGSVVPHDDDLISFSEEAGTLMTLLVWFIFGATMLVPGIQHAEWNDVAFAILALTVVRMVPVAISLIGLGLDRSTVAFIGWFGPRGLASVVFGLIAVDALAPSDAAVVLPVVTLTVGLSVLLHGVTATPLGHRYGATADRLHEGRPEHERGAPELSIRRFRGEQANLGSANSEG